MKAVCFGEMMLRLSPPGVERFFQTPALQASFGGGEANVAISLAQFGCESHYVTRLPANPVGDAALRALRAEGVHVEHVLRGGDRLGIYFAETGASQRPSTVIYDRAHSSVSELTAGAVDWPVVMQDARWFHWTGITPALGPGLAAAVDEAIDAARQAGATVSVDLNYRRKLWTEAEAQRTMRPLVQGADLVIANEEDLQAVLGVEVAHADVTRGALDVTGYRDACARVARDLDVARVAVTLRESHSASDNHWSAVLYERDGGAFHHSPRYALRVVDRIGGGDSFAAGLIFELAQCAPADRALAFAVAASALKHSIPGDVNRVSADEVRRLMAGDGSGRVQR